MVLSRRDHDRAKRNRPGFRFARESWLQTLHRKHDPRGEKRHSAAFRCDRACAAGVAFAALALVAAAPGARSAPSAITCTNPASGATWQIRIDYARATVDANPARIDAGTISWRDAKDGGNYTLDRKSGALTVTVASSTGGYFIYDRCRLE